MKLRDDVTTYTALNGTSNHWIAQSFGNPACGHGIYDTRVSCNAAYPLKETGLDLSYAVWNVSGRHPAKETAVRILNRTAKPRAVFLVKIHGFRVASMGRIFMYYLRVVFSGSAYNG